MMILTVFVILVLSYSSSIKANEVGEECIKDTSITGVFNCGVETLLKVIDETVVTKNIEIFPGLSLVRDSTISMRTSKEFREQLPLNPSERYEKIFHLLLSATKRFIEERSLQIRLSNTTVESVARALEEGRGRMKKMPNTWMFGIGAAAMMMMPMIFGTITLFSVKALMVAKVALIISSIIFIASLLPSMSVVPRWYGYGYEVPSYGVNTLPNGVNHLGGWNGWNPARNSKSLSTEDTTENIEKFSQNLAYNSF